MQAGLAEIQKNIALLTNLTEPLQVVDKRRKRIIATVYPHLKTNNARRLSGKYADRIPENLRNIDYAQAREAAMLAAFRDKHDCAD